MEVPATKRALRFLQNGEAHLRRAALDGQLLLEGERGVVSLSVQELEAMRMAGIVAVDGDVVRLSARNPEDLLLAPRQEKDMATVETETGHETVTVNVAESPLALLWRLKDKSGGRFLTAAEFRAGERLRTDYSRGQIMPRMGVNWDAAGGAGRRLGDAKGILELTDAALSARRRVERAVEAVGPELSGVLIDVCCFLKGMERVEAERGWPARSAKIVLKSALAALARHFEPPRRAKTQTVLHWGTEDYRPELR